MFPKRLSIEIRWFALCLLVTVAALYLTQSTFAASATRILPAVVLYALTLIVRLLLRMRKGGNAEGRRS